MVTWWRNSPGWIPTAVSGCLPCTTYCIHFSVHDVSSQSHVQAVLFSGYVSHSSVTILAPPFSRYLFPPFKRCLLLLASLCLMSTLFFSFFSSHPALNDCPHEVCFQFIFLCATSLRLLVLYYPPPESVFARAHSSPLIFSRLV